MFTIRRVLSMLPNNMVTPAILLVAGWYGGAKYGAPDLLMNSVDQAIQSGSDLVGTFLNNGDSAPQ